MEALIAPMFVTLLVAVIYKYGLDELYDFNSHKLPKFFPETFCLLCVSTQLGVITTIIASLVFDLTLTQSILSILTSPVLALNTFKQ